MNPRHKAKQKTELELLGKLNTQLAQLIKAFNELTVRSVLVSRNIIRVQLAIVALHRRLKEKDGSTAD